MQTFTPKQLQSAVEAGGIRSVTIAAKGTHFYIRIASRRGDGVLTKSRSPDPRGFASPVQALNELRRLGIRNGAFDTTDWTPEQRGTPARPDRSQAMSELHQMADHDRWVREQVATAKAEAADPDTQWVDHSIIEADSEAQRKRIKASMDKST